MNLADLNTKKLSQARRQFLLYFLGVVRLNDEGKVKERVGEQEYLDSLASEMWKQQIQNVTRWSKNRTHKLVQCAMMLQAISLKGCGEQDAPKSAELSGNHQVVYTLVILMILRLTTPLGTSLVALLSMAIISSFTFCLFSSPESDASSIILFSWLLLGEVVSFNLLASGPVSSVSRLLFALGVMGMTAGVAGAPLGRPSVVGCTRRPGAGVTTPAATASRIAFSSSSVASASSVGCL